MNLAPLLATLTIQTKEATQVPLVINWAQRRVVAEYEKAIDERRPCRLIILKARQLGISTLAEALLFLRVTAMGDNTNAAVVAHDRDSTEELLNKVKLYYDTFPFKSAYGIKYSTRRTMVFDNQSSIWVMTAKHTDAGRSRTIHSLHASEVAFWEEPTETMLSLKQAIPQRPGTLEILESTANGIGNWFEETWTASKTGQLDYIPMFFPWWEEPSYNACQGVHCLDGSCNVCVDESRMLSKPDTDEREIIVLCQTAGYSRQWITSHLVWRRWALANRCFNSEDLFHQEYPSTDEEAFILSGVNAFPESHLRAVYEPYEHPPAIGRLVNDTDKGGVRFVPDRSGPLRIYRWPSADPAFGVYFIGADSCYGQLAGDFAAAQVINRHNKEQVAVWQGKMNPIAFADELAKLGTYYNQAMIAPETEGPGYGTIGRLSAIYPRIWQNRIADRWPGQDVGAQLGWSSNWQRKQWAVMKLAEQIERGRVTLHDARTFSELRGYTFYGARGYSDVFGPPSNDAHDDLVMSLAICCICDSTETPPAPYEMQPKVAPGLIMPQPQDDDAMDWETV